MQIPHGITIRGYTGAETVEVVTARNEAGDIPAWDTYPAKSEYFMPLTVKKSGLSLRTLKFCVKGYVPGTMRIVLRQTVLTRPWQTSLWTSSGDSTTSRPTWGASS